jgi:hypothetical protein
MVLNCGHILCEQCLKRLPKKECPICKERIVSSAHISAISRLVAAYLGEEVTGPVISGELVFEGQDLICSAGNMYPPLRPEPKGGYGGGKGGKDGKGVGCDNGEDAKRKEKKKKRKSLRFE